LSFYRNATGATINTEWFVIESENIRVERGYKNISNSTNPFDEPLTRTLINYSKSFSKAYWDSSAIEPAPINQYNTTQYIDADGTTIVCGNTYSAFPLTSGGLKSIESCNLRTRLRNGPGGTYVFVNSYNTSIMSEDTTVTALSAIISYQANPGESL